MKITEGKITVKEEREISLRNFLKQAALDYTSAANQCMAIKNEFDARIKPYNEKKKESMEIIKSVKSQLTPKVLKELRKDGNAYEIMHNAFPKIFKKEEKP